MSESWRSKAAKALMQSGGHRDMRSKVRELVSPLLEDTGSPPTDLPAIAARLDAEIIYKQINGSGELRRLPNDTFQVVCNVTLPSARSRFTIAHELGHIIIERSGNDLDQRSKDAERLCDLIATELLMPAHVFRRDLPNELSIMAILKLAERYGTSLQSTAYRCAEVGRASVVEARHGKLGRPVGQLLGSSALQDDSFRSLVSSACGGAAGSARLYLTNDGSVRLWSIIYHPLSQRGHAILIISPVRD